MTTKSTRRKLGCKEIFKKPSTNTKLSAAALPGQLNAIHKSQAFIEFQFDGTILTANAHFLTAGGCTSGETKGHYHSQQFYSNYRRSIEYRQFWDEAGRHRQSPAHIPTIGNHWI